jgi:hypothetical protein
VFCVILRVLREIYYIANPRELPSRGHYRPSQVEFYSRFQNGEIVINLLSFDQKHRGLRNNMKEVYP